MLVIIFIIYAVYALIFMLFCVDYLKDKKRQSDLIAAQFDEIKTLIARSQPREDYEKIVWGINRYSPHHAEILTALVPYLYPLGRTLAYSFDDMVIGNLTNKSAVVFGCDGQEEYFSNWFSKNSKTRRAYIRKKPLKRGLIVSICFVAPSPFPSFWPPTL